MSLQFLGHDAFSLAKLLVKAWKEDKKSTRYAFYTLFVSMFIAIFSLIGRETKIFQGTWIDVIGFSSLGLFIACLIIIVTIQTIEDEEAIEKEIKEKEADLKANPEDSQTAWDLARIKLESYLNRNIKQVKWIFIWTVVVMLVAFAMICYGIYKIYESPNNFQPSIVATVAGLITEFVAVTFLVIYRSTMAQAKDYVNVLERINAVGMSIQVIETLSKDSDALKDATKAELAKDLLKLYGKVST